MNQHLLLENLNEEQKEAVQYKDGPLLILSGAGSGKTRVITHRIAYLIHEHNISPFRIWAVTFTNKAAKEMKERLELLLGIGIAKNLWASTFHSSCARILRKDINRLEYYSENFVIYDSNEQKTLLRDVIKQLNSKSNKKGLIREAQSKISKAKNQFIDPVTYRNLSPSYHEQLISEIYALYQKTLQKNNALDFDDLQILTIELFNQEEEVLSFYQDKFQYILVDEYQDINPVQYTLINVLTKNNNNVCVVGDDDQSIYSFRGTDIKNILDFEENYENVKVLKLERNYRSTQNILDTAWNIIQNNTIRKEKKLWTSNQEGEKITVYEAYDSGDEANFIGSKIIEINRDNEKKVNFSDIAIFYRTNAQSRLFEEALREAEIPYQIIGGMSFYERMEIKDLLAYLKIINNSGDSMNLRRIINIPNRGIGSITLQYLIDFADQNNITLYAALQNMHRIPLLKRPSLAKLNRFLHLFRDLKSTDKTSSILETIIDRTNYIRVLEKENTIEAKSRIENIEELINSILTYEIHNENSTLNDYLESISLMTNIDSINEIEEDNYVSLMTLHSSKGLEFPYVFFTGFEEGYLPHDFSLGTEQEIEMKKKGVYVMLV